MRFLVTPVAVLAAALALVGCDGLHACTLMEVPEGLTLELDVPEGVEFQAASGRIVADGKEQAFQCVSGDFAFGDGACSLEGMRLFVLLDLSAKPRTVEVHAAFDEGALAFDGSVQPKYSTSEPNGQGCGVVTKGTATIAPVSAD